MGAYDIDGYELRLLLPEDGELYECNKCGAAVSGTDLHSAFHERINDHLLRSGD
jgi:hypothetical protein